MRSTRSISVRAARGAGKAPAPAGLAAALATALTGAGVTQAAAPAEETALTIYSSARPGAIPAEFYRPLPGMGTPPAAQVPGFALVRTDRTVRVESGRSTVRFTDVAALIDPTTVTFTSLGDPATRVIEQDFRFDLVSTDKLLQRYVDRQVTLERGQGPAVTGTLLSSVDGLVLRAADGTLSAVRNYDALRFPELPGGLITRPTLEWTLSTARAGEQRARVTYQTGGITWWADYNLLFTPGRDAAQGTLDLSAWVSLINQSGASYADARLKLIAGDVHRAPQPPSPRVMVQTMEAKAADGGFAEQAFDEFHLYTLGRRTTLPNNSTKQIELFEQARRVPAQRQLVFRGSPELAPFGGDAITERGYGAGGGRRSVETWLSFRNDRASGLGIPLPAGRVRVSRADGADGALEFIGEDVIGHTPRDETVRLRLGSAFDVVGERKQVDFAVDTRAHTMEEEFAIELANHKDEDVEVLVRERLYRGANWRILSSSLPSRKESANEVSFTVKLPRNGSQTLRYRVRYDW